MDIPCRTLHSECMTASTFGKRLRAARLAKGLRTQRSLGDLVGVSGKTIQLYEGDKHPPPPDVLARLRRHLGPFDDEGDPVELAVRASSLEPWRQTALIGEYQRHQSEQSHQRGA